MNSQFPSASSEKAGLETRWSWWGERCIWSFIVFIYYFARGLLLDE